MHLLCKAGLTLSCLPLLMGAAIYRWVDENGVVNYTQLKPEGVQSELVSADTGQPVRNKASDASDDGTASSPTGSASASGSNNPDEENLSDEQRRMLSDLRAAEAARQEEIAKVRQANCEQARQMLQRLTSRGRIRVAGADGTERVMPEDERQERISEAQRAVAVNCSDTASR